MSGNSANPSPIPDDRQLLARATEDDRVAFGMLYERYVDRIYNYIYYRTGNHRDAEDLTARVFYRAMRHIGNYQDRGVPFSAWLYRIAHNLVANWHRDNSRRPELPLSDGLPLPSPSFDHPEGLLLVEEEKEILMLAIRKLHPDRQQLIFLKFIDQLSNAQIGEVMDRTEGAIKSLYHRTLLALREELHGEFPQPIQERAKS